MIIIIILIIVILDKTISVVERAKVSAILSNFCVNCSKFNII